MIRRVNEHITLVGTAHISRKSMAEVEKAIQETRPNIIAVELDRKRYEALARGRRWRDTSVYKVIRSGRAPLLLAQIFLGAIQRRMGAKENVPPGSEMLYAIRVARREGIPVALVDRDITITFRRGWQAMGVLEKMRLFWYGMAAVLGGEEDELDKLDIEEMMKEDVITLMIKDLRKIAPGISKAFIDERDSYIALKLAGLRDGIEEPIRMTGRIRRVSKRTDVNENVCGKGEEFGAKRRTNNMDKEGGESRGECRNPDMVREIEGSEGKHGLKEGDWKKKDALLTAEAGPSGISSGTGKRKVLGVLGAGHLNGVEKKITDPELPEDLSSLERVRKRKISIGKTLGYAVPVLFVLVVVILMYLGDYSKLRDMLIWWFVINGICSALGALLARGHILSILTAFIAAPLTSLNPMLAAGWFAGIVEANVRKPTVADLEELGTFERFRDFFNNGLIRVLMVAALANLGSVLGTYIAAGKIIEILL